MADWFKLAAPLPDQGTAETARIRQAILTKPTGSLGQLEEVAIQLAACQKAELPQINNPHILIFAADHGIVAEGVSLFPQEVTGQMMANFVAGGAAISVLAREGGAHLSIIDVGSILDEPLDRVVTDKVARGSANFRRQDALSASDLSHALAAGQRAVERALTDKVDLLILGEMGIGNTSAATAIAAALTQTAPAQITGAGTGINPAGLNHKRRVLAESLAFHGLAADPKKAPPLPLEVLQKVGGHDLAALTGAYIAAAQNQIPVLVDGFICTAAALAAVRLNPSCRPWMIFTHQSAEQGHGHILSELEARPLLNIGLRLGEGSGAAVALPLIRLACSLHNKMATFEDAGVSDKTRASKEQSNDTA